MTSAPTASDFRRQLAQRVAVAHRGTDAASLLSFVSGSVVEDLADERSDVDMSVVFTALPDEAALQAACQRAGGTPWFWQAGDLKDGGLVVAFRLDGIEVQIGYASHATLRGQLDELLVQHNADTPLHKLGEGILKAEPLADPTNGEPTLAQLKQRLAAFPPELQQAMVVFWLKTPTPWKAIAQIVHRDAELWCRELLVEASWRLLGTLAGLNARYFTRFQLKRMHKLAAGFGIAPRELADRIEAMLKAPLPQAFEQLHALEGEVLAQVAQHMPAVDVSAALKRREGFAAGAVA